MPIIAVGRKQTAAVPGKTSSAQVDPNATNELEGALADQSQAVTNLGKTLANVAEKVTEHYEEIQEAKKENKATDAANQIYSEASIAYAEEVNTNTGDKAAGASERWNSRYSEIFSGSTEGLDEDTRKRVSDKLKESEMQWRVKVAANEGKQTRQAKVNLTLQEIDKLNKASYDAPDMLDQNLRYAISQIKSLKLSTDDESKAIDKVVEGQHMATLRGMAERNPRTALELLDTPKFKAAFKSDESYLSAKKELTLIKKAADAQAENQAELMYNEINLQLVEAGERFKRGEIKNPSELMDTLYENRNGKRQPKLPFRTSKDGASKLKSAINYFEAIIDETKKRSEGKVTESDPNELAKFQGLAISEGNLSVTELMSAADKGKLSISDVPKIIDLQNKNIKANDPTRQQSYVKAENTMKQLAKNGFFSDDKDENASLMNDHLLAMQGRMRLDPQFNPQEYAAGLVKSNDNVGFIRSLLAGNNPFKAIVTGSDDIAASSLETLTAQTSQIADTKARERMNTAIAQATKILRDNNKRVDMNTLRLVIQNEFPNLMDEFDAMRDNNGR